MAQNENNAPNAFAGYADIFRRNHQAIVDPLVDPHAPDDPDAGAFLGTIGAFHSGSALVAPQGNWYPDYQGIVPVSEQPQIRVPEPWTDDNG